MPVGDGGRPVEWGGGGTSPEAVAELYARLRSRVTVSLHSTSPLDASHAQAPGEGAVEWSETVTGATAPPPILLLAPTREAFEAARSRIVRPLADVDVILTTSGSTDGLGHLVGLSGAALEASARATLARLRGPGQWLTSLPLHGVAGFQVVLRSALAGLDPVAYAPRGGFDPGLFADGVAALRPDVPRYLSLVPTQLVRALDADAGLLAGFHAVLVGGAALPPDVRRRAGDAGIRIVTTYGMTETAGGCVYDGVPLDGVAVRCEADGRIQLGGPVLATRYLDTAEQPFTSDASGRWLRTPDLGVWRDGHLQVLGRADDVVITGGVNVHPAVVEAALAGLGGTWVVVGVPDREWGQRLVAVTDATAPPSLDQVRAATAHLAPAERPRGVASLDTWPLRPTGKVDRRAVARLVIDRG